MGNTVQSDKVHDEPATTEPKEITKEYLDKLQADIDDLLKDEQKITQLRDANINDTEQIFKPYNDDPDREERIEAIQKLQRLID